MAGLRNQLPQKQTKNKRSTAREWAWQHNEREEKATKHRVEKKDEHIGRFKLFLLREINTLHKFSCTGNAVNVYVQKKKKKIKLYYKGAWRIDCC